MKALIRRDYVVCICTIMVLLFGTIGCDEDPEQRGWTSSDVDGDSDSDSDADNDADSDSDSDSDSDADTDADSDADGDNCTTIEWAGGCVVNNIVSNWQMTVLADTTGDHIVEPEETTLSLEELHCSGKKSVVVMMGDSL